MYMYIVELLYTYAPQLNQMQIVFLIWDYIFH
jgi:hypothetical protein